MRANPKAGWTIPDIQTICRQLGMTCTAPTRGSHWKVLSHHIPGIQTVPAERPIKTPYIRDFLKLVEAHIDACGKPEKTNG